MLTLIKLITCLFWCYLMQHMFSAPLALHPTSHIHWGSYTLKQHVSSLASKRTSHIMSTNPFQVSTHYVLMFKYFNCIPILPLCPNSSWCQILSWCLKWSSDVRMVMFCYYLVMFKYPYYVQMCTDTQIFHHGVQILWRYPDIFLLASRYPDVPTRYKHSI